MIFDEAGRLDMVFSEISPEIFEFPLTSHSGISIINSLKP